MASACGGADLAPRHRRHSAPWSRVSLPAPGQALAPAIAGSQPAPWRNGPLRRPAAAVPTGQSRPYPDRPRGSGAGADRIGSGRSSPVMMIVQRGRFWRRSEASARIRARRVQIPLPAAPTASLGRHVRPILLRGPQALCLCRRPSRCRAACSVDRPTATPQRARTRSPSSARIRSGSAATSCTSISPCGSSRPPVAAIALGCRAAGGPHPLHQLDRRRRADREPPCRRPNRAPARDRLDDPTSQIQR